MTATALDTLSDSLEARIRLAIERRDVEGAYRAIVLARAGGDGGVGGSAAVPACKIIRQIIDAGGNVDSTDAQCTTALMRACEFEDQGMVDLLLSRGASTAIRDQDGRTALHFASAPATTAALIKAGANLDAQDAEGYTALMFRVAGDDLLACEVLTSAGANVRVVNTTGESAIVHAVMSRNADAFAMLLQAGADVESLATYLGQDLIKLIAADTELSKHYFAWKARSAIRYSAR